jgi:hypothetical protein
MGELPLGRQGGARFTDKAVVTAPLYVLEAGTAKDSVDRVGVADEPIIESAEEVMFNEVHGGKPRTIEKPAIVYVDRNHYAVGVSRVCYDRLKVQFLLSDLCQLI